MTTIPHYTGTNPHLAGCAIVGLPRDLVMLRNALSSLRLLSGLKDDDDNDGFRDGILGLLVSLIPNSIVCEEELPLR